MSAEPPDPNQAAVDTPFKKKPSHKDFIFGKIIGEGSYSSVYLAKAVEDKKEYAIKVLQKQHIQREKKEKYVRRERDVLARIHKHPFFVCLYCTFQDIDRLYFVLSYAKRGELLDYIKKLGCLDEQCTKFYVGEITEALEHLRKLKIVHRDLKPENILLDEKMHIQITDFGSAKMLEDIPTAPLPLPPPQASINDGERPNPRRKNSFVGTAQYVSPEVLRSKTTHYESDLWALGCIIFQLLSGKLPFWGGHEYQIFQKILNLEYEFPEGFKSVARELVEKILVIDPSERLGSSQTGGLQTLRDHAFFNGFDWTDLHLQTPPDILPYLPAGGDCDEPLWGDKTPGFSLKLFIPDTPIENSEDEEKKKERLKEEDEAIRKEKLKNQAINNEYHNFVEGNLIVKQGFLWKRKGLFSRKRMFLMTEGPHLYYVDAQNMVLKGEIPWSKELRPEPKKFEIFFVHTPNRTYYLEDPKKQALKWCEAIEEHYTRYYGPRPQDQSNTNS